MSNPQNMENNTVNWKRFFPFLIWWPRVNRGTLKDDFLAGMTGAIIVVPQGVAFATIAGMPPEYGLYAGMIPAIIAALFGSSWHLVSGPTTAASLVLFSGLSAFAEPGTADYVRLALTLTFMVGILQLAMGLAKLGTLVNFISHSVVVGFTAGAAILILSNQVKNFVGIDIARGSQFYEVVVALFTRLDELNFFVTGVALATLGSGLLAKKLFPRFPYMIVAMLFGSVLATVLNAWLGKDVTGIATVGALPSSLPPLSAPDLTLETIKQLAPVAFAATLFALTEAVSIARSLALRAGQNIDGNQEFVGQGLSNLAGSFFSGYVATGSFNRSGLNYAAGAKTPLAAIFSGVLLIGVVVMVAPLASYLPNAAMAAILFLVGWGLIDFHHIARILRASRSETAVLLTTFGATLFLQLEFAISLGVILSLVLYLNRTSKPRIVARVPDPRLPNRRFSSDSSLPECPQLKIVRVDGSLFFGAVSNVSDVVRKMEERAPEQKHLLILANGVNFVDVAGAEFIIDEAKRRVARGGGLFFVNVKESVRSVLNRGGYLEEIGERNVFHSKTEALAVIVSERLDKNICAGCERRIFRECPIAPSTSVSS